MKRILLSVLFLASSLLATPVTLTHIAYDYVPNDKISGSTVEEAIANAEAYCLAYETTTPIVYSLTDANCLTRLTVPADYTFISGTQTLTNQDCYLEQLTSISGIWQYINFLPKENKVDCIYDAPALPTCVPPLVLDETNTICVPLTCTEPEILSSDGMSCILPSCGTNASYNYTISLCECDAGTVLTQVPDQESWCQPDADGDGLGDTTADPYPDDTDNDGIPNAEDSSPDSPASTPPEPLTEKCDKYPSTLTNYGWNNIGDFGNLCNLSYQNEINDGSNAYYSSVDSIKCVPNCLVFFTQCVYPKVYNHASRACIAPSAADAPCVPDPSTTKVIRRGDVCYNQTLCFDTGSVSSSDLVDCPDADADGIPDSNISLEGNQEAFLNALRTHGVATTFKQDEIIEQQKITNTKLSDIETNTKKSNTLLDSIDSKLTTNGANNHTDLTKIDASISALNSALSNPNALADSVNLESIATSANGTNDKLDEIKALLQTDSAVPDQNDSISMFNDSVASSQSALDGMFSDVTNSMGEVQNKIDLIKNGFVISGVKSTVTTCPLHHEFDMGVYTVPFDVDICKVTSGFHDAGYMLAYGAVLFGFVSFFLFIILGGA